MKKKTMALMLTATMAASLTACGGSGKTAETKAEETTKAESAAKEDTEAAAEKPDGSEYKIGLVTDVGGVNDASFNQSSWEGLQRAVEEFGVEVNYLESSTDSDYVPNIETFVDEEYDLIISVGYMLADATRQAAEGYHRPSKCNLPYVPPGAGFLSGRLCCRPYDKDRQYRLCDRNGK